MGIFFIWIELRLRNEVMLWRRFAQRTRGQKSQCVDCYGLSDTDIVCMCGTCRGGLTLYLGVGVLLCSFMVASGIVTIDTLLTVYRRVAAIIGYLNWKRTELGT